MEWNVEVSIVQPLTSPCRKLTLENLYWSEFEREEERENNGRQFVQLVQEQLTKPTAEVRHIHTHTHVI